MTVEECLARIAEREHGEEDEPQQREADAVAGILAERLGEIDAEDDPDDDAHARDEEQDKPPDGPPHDLEEHDGVVDRDDPRPAGLACLLEDLPQGDEDQNDDGEPHQEEGAAEERADQAGPAPAWVGILLESRRQKQHHPHRSPLFPLSCAAADGRWYGQAAVHTSAERICPRKCPGTRTHS